MKTQADIPALLESIDASLKRLVQIAETRKATAAANGKPVADDRDLDGQYGDELIKFMPRDWSGPSYVQRRMSECPAELLDMLADTWDYFADKNAREKNVASNGKPKADYDRRSAARARGWAARVRSGKVTQRPPADTGDFGEANSFGGGGF